MNIFKHQFGFFRLCSFLFVFIIGVFGVAPVYAVHQEGTFELDGNVKDSTMAAGDDWSTAVPAGPGPAHTGLLDDAAPKTIFTGGGSKDDLDLNGPLSGAGGWKHKTGSVPDKDDITNAYAVAYNVGGKLVIYAGADRFDNSGDAFMGFWFFQEKVTPGPITGNAGPFIGKHKVGDVLVLANFTGGGATVNIEVLKWVGTGGNVNGTLQRIAGAAGGVNATCNGAHSAPIPGQSFQFCGKANTTAGEVPPWPYQAKGAAPGTGFPVATFFEVGINITDVFAAAGAGDTPCFSSFMAETRSSSSVSAVLKDFALGGFEVCGMSITKSCFQGALAADKASIDYPFGGKISNTGFGSLSGIVLTDTPAAPGTPIGVPDYFKCDATTGLADLSQPLGASAGTLNGGADVCYTWKFNTTSTPTKNSIKAVATTVGTSTVEAEFLDAACPELIFTKGISVTKVCDIPGATLVPYSGALAVQVNVKGMVCNLGDLALTGVNVTDQDYYDVSLPNLVTNKTLGPKGAADECFNFTGNYKPTKADNSGSSTAFTDKVIATGNVPIFGGGGTVTTGPTFVTATCDLCTGETCRTASGATLDSLQRQLQQKKK